MQQLRRRGLYDDGVIDYKARAIRRRRQQLRWRGQNNDGTAGDGKYDPSLGAGGAWAMQLYATTTTAQERRGEVRRGRFDDSVSNGEEIARASWDLGDPCLLVRWPSGRFPLSLVES